MRNPEKNVVKLKSYQFSIEIISFVKDFPRNNIFSIIQNQLVRSATSIGANIIEAQCSGSKKDFARYYQISLKSANETLYWLCLLRDSKMLKNNQLTGLIGKATEIAKILAASLITMRGKR